MQPGTAGAYWDQQLGRQVRVDEPEWSAERFGAIVAAGSERVVADHDTIPAPPPLPEGY